MPIIGRFIAKSKLKAYKDSISNVRYDFMNNYYWGVDPEGEKYIYHLERNVIHDPVYSETMGRQIDKQYQAFLESRPQDSVEFPQGSLDAYVTIDAGDHSKAYGRVSLMKVYDVVSLDEESSKTRMCELLKEVCQNLDFTVTGVQFRYSNLTGEYEMSCDFYNESILGRDLRSYIARSEFEGQDAIYNQWKKEHEPTSD